MRTPLALLGGGGGGRGGSYGSSTTKESTLSNADDMSAEESAYRAEAELELGLGLSLGGGGLGKVKATAWGERGRILTAQDFPAVVCHSGSSNSSRFSAKGSGSVSAGGAVSGTKRAAADSVPQEGGSPTAVSQVVGWPPIRAYRMNSLVNRAKTPRTEEEEKETGEKDRSKDALMKKVSDNDKTNASTIKEKVHVGFVKVNMDGVVIGRKLDLNAHSCYETLALMLEDMFLKPTGSANPTEGDKDHQATKVSKLLDGSSEFVLTYEDREGDWMLVGDVPWRMFCSSVKKLRIMRTSEANGLAPRCQERFERQRSKRI